MKKPVYAVLVFLLSVAVLTACEGAKDETGGSTGKVDVGENGSGPDDERGRLEGDKGDEDMTGISGSIVPVVSGTISPVEGDDEEFDAEIEAETISGNTSTGRELMAITSSEEEAQEIAETYGIELVEYEYGVAVYHTDEDPGTVVQRGVDNGWPPISVNHRSSLIE